MIKAVGLLSGGLDSSLAVKLMLDQGIDVYALNFVTPFCTCSRKGCQHEAKRVAEKFGIPLKIIKVDRDYIDIVKKPKYGYGRNMNPCIDCRIFMFQRAKKFMQEIGASFIFTGEVLGQRPMSQHRRAMKIIEKESGLEGLVLRPLSARLLEPTLPEKLGLIDREKLLAITGRRRITQMKLAEEFNIKDYPCPAGGCRLTDPNFAERIRDAFQHGEDSLEELYLLRYGRHFRLPSGSKVVVGRNEKENQVIQRFAREEDILLEVVDTGSPITLLRKGKNRKDIEEAGNLCIRYSDAKIHKDTKVKLMDVRGRINKTVAFIKIDDSWQINSEIDFLDEIFLNYEGEENGREI